MNGVNLRLSSLKGASLRSCNLRYAIMAGTDLEVSKSHQKHLISLVSCRGGVMSMRSTEHQSHTLFTAFILQYILIYITRVFMQCHIHIHV